MRVKARIYRNVQVHDQEIYGTLGATMLSGGVFRWILTFSDVGIKIEAPTLSELLRYAHDPINNVVDIRPCAT